jgi:tRNA C32,U32 (ribose-2'-O)-methylase TrmJ
MRDQKMTFTTLTGATVNLSISFNDQVAVDIRAGATRIDGWADRATDAAHGEVLIVKHSKGVTTVRIPADALADVDAVFADSAARRAASAARRAPINAALDRADADYARTMRALHTGRA